MARTRLELHAFLKEYCNTENVYFQPPPSMMMKYPAIVYHVTQRRKIPANNHTYLKYVTYEVTVIDKNPESSIASLIEELPMCTFDRSFTSDNLNHFVYTLFY